MDGSLWSPFGLANDSFGNIYVSDDKGNYVSVFGPAGKFIRKFGRSGQGPGDLSMPAFIQVIGEEIFVYEGGNRRIQVFDRQGHSKRMIKLLKGYRPTIRNDGTIVGYTSSFGGSKKLIEVLSPKGDIIRMFGEPLPFDWSLNQGFVAADDGRVYVMFTYVPVMRVYADTGDLVLEREIVDQAGEIKWEYNEQSFKGRTRGASMGYSPLFRAMKWHRGHIYLLDSWPGRLWIKKYDQTGSHVATFWSRGEEISAQDFLIIEGPASDIRFLVLQRSPEAKVRFFAPAR